MAEENAGSGSGGGTGGGQPIIIKKIKKGGGHGHHGGAWKVAYADFVTAMMAFFLLLWLLATTSKEQKQGIAHYFNPPSNASEYGGGAGIMGGESVVESQQNSAAATPEIPKSEAKEELSVMAKEDQMFKQLSAQLKKTIMNIPELMNLLDNLVVDITPEGLRLQLTDSKERPLFEEGTATMYPYTAKMLAVVSNVLSGLPNQLAVGGHTNVVPFRGEAPTYTNWELSADRAQSTRRIMVQEGIVERRMARVAGYAAQELLVADQPTSEKNARISIIVLRSKRGPIAAFSQDGLLTPENGTENVFPAGTPTY